MHIGKSKRTCQEQYFFLILIGAKFLSSISIVSGYIVYGPTKIGVHAFDINPYLHEFIEPIPID